MKTEMMSLRISKEVKTQLDLIAKATGRSKSYIVEKALNKYCNLIMHQSFAVNNAIKQADDNDLLTQAQVKDWMLKL